MKDVGGNAASGIGFKLPKKDRGDLTFPGSVCIILGYGIERGVKCLPPERFD